MADNDHPLRDDREFVDFVFGYTDYVGARLEDLLFEVSRELKKRPVLQMVLKDAAFNCRAPAFLEDRWPEIKERERDRHPEDLYRDLLVEMPDARRRQQQVLIQEIAHEARALRDLWSRIEAAEGEKEKELYEEWCQATIAFDHKVFVAIAEQRVDPQEAAAAALMQAGFELSRWEHPALLGEEVA